MGILQNVQFRASKSAADDSWYYPGGFYYGGSAGAATLSGSQISETSAMQLPIVGLCIRILSEDPASLPLRLFRRLPGGGKERATDHPADDILHSKSNPEMPAMNFRETIMAHMLSWGNGYAEIETGRGWVNRGTPVALWPITPNRVTPKRNDSGKLVYQISMAGTGKNDIILPAEKILHIRGLSFDGIIGYSPIRLHMETVGLSRTLQDFASLYFGQGTHPGVIVSHPGKLSADAHSNLQRSLSEAHSGLGKSHRLLLLEEAMKMEKIGIPNDEAQFLETRKYGNVDIGTRIYRIPPYMYGEMERTAFANVEQQSIDYVIKTLRPYLVRTAQQFDFSLLSDAERKEYFFEYNYEELLRGSMKDRMESLGIAKSHRILTTNEVREKIGENPKEGEDDLDVTPNMTPKSKQNKKDGQEDEDE